MKANVLADIFKRYVCILLAFVVIVQSKSMLTR